MTAPTSPLAKGSPVRAWLPWALLFVVVVALLAFGAQGTTGTPTEQDRVIGLARTIACPRCNGESAADSNHPTSQEIRRDIAARVQAGESDDEIRGYYASQYGEAILLTPPSSGVGALVWVIPVVAVAAAVVGLVVVFRRWQAEPHAAEVSDADRALVEGALRGRGPAAGPAEAGDDPQGDGHGEGSSR